MIAGSTNHRIYNHIYTLILLQSMQTYPHTPSSLERSAPIVGHFESCVFSCQKINVVGLHKYKKNTILLLPTLYIGLHPFNFETSLTIF